MEQQVDDVVRTTGRAALAGGVLGFGALVTTFVIEARSGGMASVSSTGAALAGWASFLSASLLSVGLVGLAVRYLPRLSRAGRRALLVLGFTTAITVGATSTLALVVPDLLDRMPEIVNDPPAAVPPTFILSGLVSGVCAIVLGVALRRAGVPGRGTTLLFVGAVLTMVPLPSRFFMLAIAVGVLLLARDEGGTDESGARRAPAVAGTAG